MGRLHVALSFLARGLPIMPTGVPASMLIVPSGALGVVACLSTFNSQSPLQMLVFAAIVGTFVFTVHARTWAIVPLLLVDLSIANFWVNHVSMSLRFIVTGLAVFLMFPRLVQARATLLSDPAMRRVIGPALCFIVCSTVINLLFSELGYVAKYLRYQLVLLVTLVLMICAVQDRRSAIQPALAMFAMVIVSSLVALGQRAGGGLAWYVTNSGHAPIDVGVRVLGLTDSPVTLANALVSVVVPALGVLVACWSNRFRGRFFLLFVSVLPLVGTYLTLTRSALIAIAAGTVTILALVDARRRLHMLAFLGVCAGLAGLMVLVGVIDQRLLSGTAEDTSAAGHLALSQVALAVALDHPLLGIGHENFELVSRAYQSDAFVGSSGPPGQASSGAIGVYRPHNDFLEVWTSWGIVGLLTYLAIFVGALHNCI